MVKVTLLSVIQCFDKSQVVNKFIEEIEIFYKICL